MGAEKWCPGCDQVLPLDAFGRHRQYGSQYRCRECLRAGYRAMKARGTRIRSFQISAALDDAAAIAAADDGVSLSEWLRRRVAEGVAGD